ncbi:NYN domain-containing protein [Eionea flava]
MNKVAVFVDVQNIYYTTRDTYQRSFNYRQFWQNISQQSTIVSAYAYAIHRGDEQQLRFQQALKSIGFTVKCKPYIQRQDGSAKGDWDVGITIDIMAIAAEKSVDKIILLSGDGDFDLLLEKVKRDYHIPVDVYGVPALTAKSLIDSASAFLPITTDMLMN